MSKEKRTRKSDEKDGNSKDRASETQTLVLLQQIRKGSVDPKSLSSADRQWLVLFLTVEGQSTAEIAHFLKVSDRTIERDKKAMREENAITKDPKLLEQIVGRLISEAELCIQRIRKFQRDSEASPAAKIDGEHRCFQIFNQFVERLQSLGHLPTATQKIEADLRHSAASSLSLEEIQHEAGRLKQIQETLPDDGTKHIDSAVEANETVTEFEDNSPQQDNNKGENNETAK